MANIYLRERRENDDAYFWKWQHQIHDAEWKRWDAPYFHESESPSLLGFEEYSQKMVKQRQTHILGIAPQLVIVLNDQCIGSVSRYEEHPQGGGWWEVGILIHDPQFWGQGYGTQALKLWIDNTFQQTNAHLISLTSWSGNQRMLDAARRIGFSECARIPEARFWQGKRWDSVRMAVLREAWPKTQV